MIDPNTPAMILPSIAAVGQSLFAGYWEECLFRAVPIAGGALCGAWLFNCKPTSLKLMVPVFLLQAVIFGGAHANYPAQPSYARLIELILPSIAFGMLYFQFGLLPGIVMHYLYDLVWFALPIFLTPPSAMLLDKAIVIAAALLPCFIVFVRSRGIFSYSGSTSIGAKGAQDAAEEEIESTTAFCNVRWFEDQKRLADAAAAAKEAATKRAATSSGSTTAESVAKPRGAAPAGLLRLLAVIAPVLIAIWAVNLPSNQVPWQKPVGRHEAIAAAKEALVDAPGGGSMVFPATGDESNAEASATSKYVRA